MSKSRVLISGASVAGPALAYWLVRAGCQVTVVERATSLRPEGQGIDVRDTARDVIKKMGLFEIIRERSSQEEGIQFVDSQNRTFASFGVDLESGKGDSMTCDIEILRGELAKILFDATKDEVSYIFGDMVESLEETEQEAKVNFVNGAPRTAFDLVVAADGIGSKIRGMAFGDVHSHIRSRGAYITYFSIPKDSAVDTMWSRVHWVKGGRCLVLRPDNIGRTRVFLMQTFYDYSDERLARLHKASKEGMAAQKALIQELFQDGDWEISRLLEGMHKSDEFYFQHVAQVRVDRWSSGRVALVGDAGYAPTPFSGMGTSIAFIGAYVLAGEISKYPEDIPAALNSYERIMRPYVESIQNLLPGIPWIVNPQSALGVKVLETAIWGIGILSKTRLAILASKAFGYFEFGADHPFKLPEYEAFNKQGA